MARPIQADAGATKQRVLEAACSLFAELGLSQTTTRQIAKRAEVSLATMHHYFGTKGDLYQTCIDTTYTELGTLADELEAAALDLGQGTTLSSLVEMTIRRSYEFARRHRAEVRLLMRRILDKGEADPELRERYQLPLLERGVAMLAAATQRPVSSVRITFLAMHHIIVNFALTSSREIAIVTGNPTASPEQCITLIEDHLVSMALTQLGLQGNSP